MYKGKNFFFSLTTSGEAGGRPPTISSGQPKNLCVLCLASTGKYIVPKGLKAQQKNVFVQGKLERTSTVRTCIFRPLFSFNVHFVCFVALATAENDERSMTGKLRHHPASSLGKKRDISYFLIVSVGFESNCEKFRLRF